MTKQENEINRHRLQGWFIFPCCKSEIVIPPRIENLGENKTQVYCCYGCGYIYLNDFHAPKKLI